MAAEGQAAAKKKAAPKAAAGDAWPPTAISDEKVKAATGRGWMGWFVILNRMGATSLPHKEVARRLKDEHGAPSWWCQMIAVSYERARGGRKVNERAGGTFAVNVTKVMPVPLAKLFATATDPKTRKAWFPPGAFEETSKTENKYWRGKWKSAQKLEFGFTAKGDAKSQIALEISKLASADAVETTRVGWKKAMERLEKALA
jgi:uncharacterized protein YndB with AHSA1/START domain